MLSLVKMNMYVDGTSSSVTCRTPDCPCTIWHCIADQSLNHSHSRERKIHQPELDIRIAFRFDIYRIDMINIADRF